MNNLLQLFWSFVKIGALSFGGGYAVLPLIESEIVMELGWLTPEEFIDILTLSEMTPGPIAINAATFAGNRIEGIIGGIVATTAVVLPSFVITLILAYIYSKYSNLEIVQGVIAGLRPAVVALIASAGVTIFVSALTTSGETTNGLASINWINFAIFALGTFLIRKYRLSPIQVIILGGLLGGIIYTVL